MSDCRSLSEQLQAQLDRLPARPSGLLELGHALASEPGPGEEQHCAACQEALPDYVEAELNGQPTRRLFPNVARHLDACLACGEAYVGLLEVALQAEAEPLAVPTSTPDLDLSFLPSLTPTAILHQFVEMLTEELVRSLNPEALGDLPALSRGFFHKLDELGANLHLQPASTLALGFGADLSPALRSLVAAYNATETILHTLSIEELAEELGGPRRPRTVERQARSSVRATGLGRGESKKWAEQYVVLAQAHAMEFLTLARQIAENERSD